MPKSTNLSQPKIVMLTAGAGGMYCGSCIHDNTLAASLQKMGVDAMLVPTYTPIRTDEDDVSIDRVFMGGINVYLQQKLFVFRYLPDVFTRWLDNPRLIRWVTSRNMETDGSKLGDLTLSMLRGENGNQRREVQRLCRWLKDDIRPDVVVFSNLLIAGCAPLLQKELGVPILVTLQGDDVFLDQLPDGERRQAVVEMRQISESIRGFLTHSRYYADYMSDYLGIDRARFSQIPLAIRTADFSNAGSPSDGVPTVGYLARLAPEKGLHLLVDAMIKLRKRSAARHVRLRIAGWAGDQHRRYADDCIAKMQMHCGQDSVELVGEVDRAGKAEFLNSIDVLSVPCPYREPKGIYILEALAAGVPVVQPAHGAFPELIGTNGGGLLFEPNDSDDLAERLFALVCDSEQRKELGRNGQAATRSNHDAMIAAERTLDVIRRITDI